MPKIRACVAAADAAGALRIDRAPVADIARVFDQDAAFARVQASVTSSPRGEHAIHHVDASSNVVGELLGPPNAHQVARARGRQERGDLGGHFAGNFVGFADGEAAYGVARKIEFEQPPRALAAQVGIRRALHDAKLPLRWVTVAVGGFEETVPGATGPVGGALERSFSDIAR